MIIWTSKWEKLRRKKALWTAGDDKVCVKAELGDVFFREEIGDGEAFHFHIVTEKESWFLLWNIYFKNFKQGILKEYIYVLHTSNFYTQMIKTHKSESSLM